MSKFLDVSGKELEAAVDALRGLIEARADELTMEGESLDEAVQGAMERDAALDLAIMRAAHAVAAEKEKLWPAGT